MKDISKYQKIEKKQPLESGQLLPKKIATRLGLGFDLGLGLGLGLGEIVLEPYTCKALSFTINFWRSFTSCLDENKIRTTNERNIKILETEMFKVSKNIAPPQMHEIFKLTGQPQYNLRNNSLFSRPRFKSVYKGTES